MIDEEKVKGLLHNLIELVEWTASDSDLTYKETLQKCVDGLELAVLANEISDELELRESEL